MDRQQLIEFIDKKEDSLDFWVDLQEVCRCNKKISLLKNEILIAKIKFKKMEGFKLDIRLIQLIIKNFKGIKKFSLDIFGKNADVFGDNGCGKTSLYDAFLWVMFGKDSTDRKQFSIKPQDSQGKDIHHLETEVEAIFLVDGNEVKFKKMFCEKWTKKRGQEHQEFSGHETCYWVDDVPVKQNEYQRKLSELLEESIFKLITNPLFFNTQLSWQFRRNTLLEIAGDISDLDVIASNRILSKLAKVLNGKSTDDYKKILNERLKKLKEEVEKIPVRIDEAMLSIPNVEPDYTSIDSKLEQLKAELDEIELQLNNSSKVANTYMEKQRNLNILERSLKERKQALDDVANADNKKFLQEKSNLEREKNNIEYKMNLCIHSIDANNKQIESEEEKRKKLLETWEQEYKKKFVEPDEDNFNCPTCGQCLPTYQKEFKIAELKTNFINNKNSILGDIETKGKSILTKIDGLKTQNESESLNITNHESRIIDINNRISEIKKLVTDDVKADYEADSSFIEIKKSIEKLNAELEAPVESVTNKLLDKKKEINEKINSCNKILNQKETIQNTKSRIEELNKEEKDKASLINELEGQKYLLEEFTKSKVDLLEDSINSKFKTVKFKLFDVQINGGVVDCCETLVNTNGSYVQFQDANHAGKVNAGLDIINTLCSHYKVNAPIFIDFRESVSRILQTDSQVINLIKNEPDKDLRVEVEQ